MKRHDDPAIQAAKGAHDDAAADICEHVLDCSDGCTMRMAVCPTGQQLAESERSAWHTYYAARYGEVSA